jgi:hypothetical protein
LLASVWQHGCQRLAAAASVKTSALCCTARLYAGWLFMCCAPLFVVSWCAVFCTETPLAVTVGLLSSGPNLAFNATCITQVYAVTVKGSS